MKIQANKTQQNTSKAIANNSPKQQGEVEFVSKFENNRPEAIQMIILREKINNSRQVKQFKTYQRMANNNASVAQFTPNAAELQRYNENFKQSAIDILTEIHKLNPTKSDLAKSVSLKLKMNNPYFPLEERNSAMDELRLLKDTLATNGIVVNRRRAIIEDAGHLEKNIINACNKFPNDLFHRLKSSNKILLAQIRDEYSSPDLMEKKLIELQTIWVGLEPNSELLAELYPQLDSIISLYSMKIHKYSNDKSETVINLLQPLGKQFVRLQKNWNEFKDSFDQFSMKELKAELANFKVCLKAANDALAIALTELEAYYAL